MAITLFLYEGHYCWVRYVSELVSRQIVDNTVHICDYCCFVHRNQEVVDKHQEKCLGIDGEEVEIVMPKPNKKTQFKNHERRIEQPFSIYFDFESRLVPMEVKFGKGTTQYQEHTPSGYAYQLVSRVDPKNNKFVHYTAHSDDEDVADHFFKSLEKTTKELYAKYEKPKPMIITGEQQHEFELASKCWVCGGEWNDDEKHMKVRDHCHYTGEYHGAAHSKCNLKLRRTRVIPVFAHDFTNYDNHLFIKVLGRSYGKISVIARMMRNTFRLPRKSQWHLKWKGH